MLIWWHDYFARKNQIYLFLVDANLVAWYLCPTKSHLLFLQVEQVDVIFVEKDIAIVFWYKIRCTEFLPKKNEFQFLESGFRFDDFSTAEF